MAKLSRHRKICYVLMYEFFAIIFGALIIQLFEQQAEHTSTFILSVIVSVIAMVWNYLFNTIFEWCEDRFCWRRTLWVRFVHATGFEGTLMLACVPIYMFWFDISFWAAFQMEVGLLMFFFFYTYVYTWCFDRLWPRQAVV